MERTEKLLLVSSSPHVRDGTTVREIMGLVLLALAPAGAVGVYFFGLHALWVILTCVAFAVGSEALFQKALGRKVTVGDLSAAVTGLLLAYNLPPTMPLWMAALGSTFAIVVVKQLYGGIGKNIVNPALAARAFLMVCFPAQMTRWTLHGVSTATPLAVLKGVEASGELPPLLDLAIGRIGGCIGETSALALLAGGLLLLWKRVISWHIPVVYVGTVALLSLVLRRPSGLYGGPLYEVFAGGLMLGAIYMATDYTTTPMTRRGQVVFALGCGLLTTLIRVYGSLPEGVSYSILFMNLLVPVIDRRFKPRIFGVRSDGRKA